VNWIEIVVIIIIKLFAWWQHRAVNKTVCCRWRL